MFGGLVCAATAVACGATSTSAGTTPSSTTGDAGSPTRGGESDGGDAGPKEGHPFAGSTGEATELIAAAVDKRQAEIQACVREFRTRKKMPGRVVVSFGIDQDGRLLGVTARKKEDPELKSCMQEALKGAPFPRSHAGVITVTKTYEDIVVP